MSTGSKNDVPAPSAVGPHYRLQSLGEFKLTTLAGEDVTPKGLKARALIAFLVSRDSRGVMRDRLCALLWSDRAEDPARASLRQTLSELRPLAEGGAKLLTIDREHVELEPDALELDIDEIEVAARDGGLDRVNTLLANWDGRIFSDLTEVDPSFDDWLGGERSRQQDVIVKSVLEAAENSLDSTDIEVKRDIVAKLQQVQPANEEVLRLGMKIDHRAGDIEALRERYRSFCEGLKEDATPSVDSKELLRAFTAEHDVEVEAAAASPAPAVDEPSADAVVPVEMAAPAPLVEQKTAVAEPAPPLEPVNKPRPRRNHAVAWAASALTVAAVVAGIFLFRPFDELTAAPTPQAMPPYVAVLPFDNLSKNPDFGYVSDGVSAEIQAGLARFQSGVRVADLSTGFRFRDEGKRPANVKAITNASHVVDGSVRRVGNSVRVVVQLIETQKGRVVWAEVYNYGLDSLLDVQSGVARRTAETFKIAPPQVAVSQSVPPAAVEHYLRAMGLLGQGLDEPSRAAQVISELEAATQLAPDFAAAWAALEQAQEERALIERSAVPSNGATSP